MNKDYITNLNVLSTIQRRKQSRVTSITPRRSYGSDQLRVKEPKINDTFYERNYAMRESTDATCNLIKENYVSQSFVLLGAS